MPVVFQGLYLYNFLYRYNYHWSVSDCYFFNFDFYNPQKEILESYKFSKIC